MITDACVKQDELHSMLKRTGDILKLVEQFDTEIVYALKVSDWGDEERVHGAVAACYLKSIEKSKGEHALMIASNIREAMERDREKEAETSFEIVVPLHIQEAIKWVTRTTGS